MAKKKAKKKQSHVLGGIHTRYLDRVRMMDARKNPEVMERAREASRVRSRRIKLGEIPPSKPYSEPFVEKGVKYYRVNYISLVTNVPSEKIRELTNIGVLPKHTVRDAITATYNENQFKLLCGYLTTLKLDLLKREKALKKLHKNWRKQVMTIKPRKKRVKKEPVEGEGTKGFVFTEWYHNNKEDFNAKRRARYQEDKAYREAAANYNKKYRKSSKGQTIDPRVREFMVDGEIIIGYNTRKIANELGTDPSKVSRAIKSGDIPQATLTQEGQQSYYSSTQVQKVVSYFKHHKVIQEDKWGDHHG